MAAQQTAFDFGPIRPAPWLLSAPAPEVERQHVAARLQQRLASLLGQQVELTFTDNARSMLSARKRDRVTHVRLHHMFAAADDSIVTAVARYLSGAGSTASQHLSRFIESHRDRIKRARRAHTALRVDGHHHDLLAIYQALNVNYFEGGVQAQIGWARNTRAAGRSRRRRSIKLGSYYSRGALIRVHPVLDAAWVPRMFVEYIVYHEMLHHVIPMPMQNGRRRLHGADFRTRERMFEHFALAHAWEQANLDRLLSG
jgi:predicted metal-dependent hydrolase